MSRAVRLSVAALTALAAAGGAGGYWYYRHTPQYALAQIQSAVARHDRVAFERYVDVDHFSDAFVDQFTGSLTQQATANAKGKEGLAGLGTALAVGFLEHVKPAMSQAFRSGIRGAVESGRADSLFTRPAADDKVDMRAMASQLGAGASDFAGVGPVERSGGVAIVKLRFRPELLDTTVALGLRMEQKDGGWRVTGPDDLGGYMRHVKELQDRRLKAANDSAASRLHGLVQFGALKRNAVVTGLFQEAVHFELPVRNVGTQPVAGLSVTFGDGAPGDLSTLTLSLPEGASIAPGQTGTATGTLHFNPFIEAHRTFRDGKLDPWQAHVAARLGGPSPERIEQAQDWTSYLAAHHPQAKPAAH